MVLVGGSVAVSGVLVDGPVFTAQCVRYALACLLILCWVRMTGRGVHRPRGAEWFWLVGVAVAGLVIFNVALVEGSRHAEPAVLAVAVAVVPVVLALVGPLMEGRRPAGMVVVGAVVVCFGAVLVEGVGRCDAVGLIWAIVVFASEACFTLLAVPVLRRHGAEGVTVHTTWLAAAAFAVLALVAGEPSTALDVGLREVLTVGYLSVGVTAVAFVLWYTCVRGLGAGRAGLFSGVAPIAAATAGVALSGEAPAAGVWLGALLITAGLSVGLSGSRCTVSGTTLNPGPPIARPSSPVGRSTSRPPH